MIFKVRLHYDPKRKAEHRRAITSTCDRIPVWRNTAPAEKLLQEKPKLTTATL